MYIQFSKRFQKSLDKQPLKIKNKFKTKILIFREDQFHYSLNNHALTGKLKGWRSINITGDIRVHYKEMKNGVILTNIGSHSDLY